MGQRLTREDIVRLGRGPDPWAFLSVMGQVLRAAPRDHGLRFLAATNLARAGLRAPALQQLNLLPPDARAHTDIVQLREAAEKLPDRRLDPDARVANCRANLGALAERADPASAVFDRWRGRIAAEEAFVTTDGNVIRRPTGDPDPTQWIGVVNHRSIAQQLSQQLAAGADPLTAVSIEGIDPPWLLERVAAYLMRDPGGSRARLTILQGDPFELLDALSLADLRAVLKPDRVHLFVGADAGSRYADWLDEHRATAPIGVGCVTPGVRTRTIPPVETALDNALEHHETAHEELVRVLGTRARERDPAWWARRYADARAGGQPLRVLVPTCRFSTYIRHAARDLADAFRRAGCTARVLIEPADHARLTRVGYLEAFGDFDPDLIVLLNYPRAAMGETMPAGVPYVCWIQDAMPHLFDAEVGRAQGPLDFVAGHLHPELFDRFGYPPERALRVSVTASEAKFHPAPVDPASAERFACEIAVLTNHSETPEAMQARLRAEAGATGALAQALDTIASALWDIARRSETETGFNVRTACVGAIERSTGRDTPPETRTSLLKHYAMPLVDRILRHRVLEWAASIAERRDWRLCIYGRGWNRHPVFSRFAAGEVEHGEPLRACYQSAACHLHVSVNGPLHQRVFEAALSGGLPLCLRTSGDHNPFHTLRRFLRTTDPDTTRDDRIGYIIADHPPVMGAVDAIQSIGRGLFLNIDDGAVWFPGNALERARSGVEHTEPTPLELLVDLPSTTFATETELERLVERAIDRPAWRSAISGAIARRVRASFTTEGFATRLLGFVESELCAQGGSSETRSAQAA